MAETDNKRAAELLVAIFSIMAELDTRSQSLSGYLDELEGMDIKLPHMRHVALTLAMMCEGWQSFNLLSGLADL